MRLSNTNRKKIIALLARAAKRMESLSEKPSDRDMARRMRLVSIQLKEKTGY
jgi:hypothetical protein